MLILARRLKKYRNVLTWQNTPKWWTAGHAEIAIAYASTSTNETTPLHSTNLTIATVSTLNFQSELSLINGRIQLKNQFISAIMNTESRFRHSRTSQTVTSISQPNLGLSDQSSQKSSLSGHVHAHSSKNLIIVTVSNLRILSFSQYDLMQKTSKFFVDFEIQLNLLYPLMKIRF